MKNKYPSEIQCTPNCNFMTTCFRLIIVKYPEPLEIRHGSADHRGTELSQLASYGRCPVRNLVRIAAILTDVFHSFPQSFETNPGMVP